MSEPKRLILVEDQTLILGALATLLNMEDDFVVVGQASDAEQALQLLASQPVDVVLTDIEMPGMGGLELARRLRAAQPDLVIGIITTFARKGYLRQALDAGVQGYLLKDTSANDLASAIRRMCLGEKVIDPELAAAARGGNNPLSEREREVLRLAAEGLTTEMIAQRVHRSEGTVRNYLSEAISKLNARNRVEAARIARDQGFL
ncbi:MAG: response regulator transcription factor [Natronospirillum sp.]|uniref:response regulator transcription factor n=1 Tax=Natronospirillum sp. TaxID=2812955 RepID=UPI0025CCEBFF|nr:response regulator transcription factor [Natronospirillum sp.]MCH8550721.1 response regulator transcription factor [Natronospirillum sp.]